MRWVDAVRMKLRALARRRRVEDELDDELRFHFESVVERCIAEGLTPAAARRRARLEHGGMEQIKEGCREARGVSFIENLCRDVVYAWRGFRRAPGFTLAAAGTIALAVGVNTALFSLIYGVVFRPLPVQDADTLRNVYLEKRGPGRRSTYGTKYFVSFAEFGHMRAHARTAELAGVAETKLSWRGAPGGRLQAQLVSDNLLPMIGGRPILGRFFTRDEAAQPGGSPVVVLSHAAWKNYLGGARDVVGRTLLMNRTQFTVIGVADEDTFGPLIEKPDAWIPYTMQRITRPGEAVPLIDDPGAGWIQVFARRNRGFGDTELRAEMQVLAQQSMKPHLPEATVAVSVPGAAFLNYPMIRSEGAPMAAMLFLAVSLVLVVACANVANMLLARGFARRREIAVRLSIGAGARRLLQQLLTESLLLGVFGGALGLALSQAAARAIVAMIPASEVGPMQLQLAPDWRILLYTLGVSLAAGLIFGLVPALRLLRVELTPALKDDGSAGSGARRLWLQHGLIAIQVAVCLVLLINAGLLLRGFQRAVEMDPGQAVRNVLIAAADLRQQQYTPEKAGRFIERLRDGAAALPGVRAATLGSLDPYTSSCSSMVRTLRQDGTASEPFLYACEEVGLDYFDVMGVRLNRGREFSRADYGDAAKVAIVDEDFARRFAGLGSRVRLGDNPEDDHEIVGVAAPTKMLQLGTRESPKVYTPLRGRRAMEAKLLVSYAGTAAPVSRGLAVVASKLDPEVNLTVKPIEENVHTALLSVRMVAAATSTLGVLGLVLACAGVYGVVSFTVGRRRREVGLRIALGASRADVLRLIVWQGLKPVAAGAVIGAGLAAAAAQLIRGMLYGVSPADPLAFASTAGILALTALLAALLPTRAALRVDPATTLRHE